MQVRSQTNTSSKVFTVTSTQLSTCMASCSVLSARLNFSSVSISEKLAMLYFQGHHC
jgi:hypothetical protein